MSKDLVGTVRRQHNAVGVKVFGGWTVVWTLFHDSESRRGYFYSDDDDDDATAAYISSGQRIGEPSEAEIKMFHTYPHCSTCNDAGYGGCK